MDINAICRRQGALESHRSNFESLWENAAKRLMPHHDDFRTKRASGSQRNHQRYDAFPQLALNRYAAAMESGLTPRTQVWHSVSTGVDELDQEPGPKAWLEECSRILWRNRYSPRANFANQNHEVLLSHGAFGNGCLFIEADDDGNGCVYRSIHLSQCYIEQDRHGRNDTVHRKFEMTTRGMAERFGEDKLPGKAGVAWAAGKLDEKFEILHVVMPRRDYEKGRLDHSGKKFTDIYIFLDNKEPLIGLNDSGFHEMPYAFARGVTSSEEIYGRGPGIQLLPDIMMLNEMRRDMIEAANMAVDPPTLLHESNVLSEFRLQPGARNYGGVDDNGRQMAVPYMNGSDTGLTLELIKDVRDQIDDAMMGIYFRTLRENPNMTATQALLLSQQQGQMTGPTIGRLQSEYLDTLIRRESGILHRQGKHPEIPEEMAEYLIQSRERLSINYESPLTRAAMASEAIAVQQTFESLAPWAQVVGPEVYASFDTSKVARLLSRVNGVPQDVMKTDEQMAEEADAQQQQAAMQQILEAAPVAAQTVKTMGEAQAQQASNPLEQVI